MVPAFDLSPNTTWYLACDRKLAEGGGTHSSWNTVIIIIIIIVMRICDAAVPAGTSVI